jgi:O-antigen ligase
LTVALWAGLSITFSQSSLIALLVGLSVLAALRWHLRWTAAIVAGGVLAALLFVVLAGGTLKLDVNSGASINKRTSGRASLISGGLELASDRPVWGYGSGSFARSFREQHRGRGKVRVAASHTEPVTIAAEQGAIGIVAYLALLAAAVYTMLGGIGRVAPGPSRGWRSRPGGAIELRGDELPAAIGRVAIAAAFAVLLVHTMTYASFLPDPLTWAMLAIGGALAARS